MLSYLNSNFPQNLSFAQPSPEPYTNFYTKLLNSTLRTVAVKLVHFFYVFHLTNVDFFREFYDKKINTYIEAISGSINGLAGSAK